MAGHVRENDHLSTIRSYHMSFRRKRVSIRGGRVIPSFRVDRGSNGLHHIDGGSPIKDHNVVNTFQGRQNFGSIILRIQRPSRSFDGPHRDIAVDRQGQSASQIARCTQVARMPDVEQIEAPVGQDQRAAMLPYRRAAAPEF